MLKTMEDQAREGGGLVVTNLYRKCLESVLRGLRTVNSEFHPVKVMIVRMREA